MECLMCCALMGCVGLAAIRFAIFVLQILAFNAAASVLMVLSACFKKRNELLDETDAEERAGGSAVACLVFLLTLTALGFGVYAFLAVPSTTCPDTAPDLYEHGLRLFLVELGFAVVQLCVAVWQCSYSA